MILLHRLHDSIRRHRSVPLQFDFSCLRCFSQWDVARSCWSPVHVCSHTRLSGWPRFWNDRVKVHTVLEISVTALNVYLTMSVYDGECNETLTELPACNRTPAAQHHCLCKSLLSIKEAWHEIKAHMWRSNALSLILSLVLLLFYFTILYFSPRWDIWF